MFSFFSNSDRDHELLENWREVPSNFDPNQPTDSSWNVDGYEVILGKNDKNEKQDLFSRASDHLLRYNIYPVNVMTHTSDFGREDRHLRPGDRIIQRVRLIPGILDIITMNKVQYMIFERQRKGFTVYTTENHIEIGEWTAAVSLKKNGDVAFMMHSISKLGPKMPKWGIPFARPYQLRAHRLGLEHFTQITKI